MKKQPKQTISIFGTGLIGGSFAKSLHQKYNIIGIDIAKQTSDIFLTQLEIENTAEIKKTKITAILICQRRHLIQLTPSFPIVFWNISLVAYGKFTSVQNLKEITYGAIAKSKRKN